MNDDLYATEAREVWEYAVREQIYEAIGGFAGDVISEAIAAILDNVEAITGVLYEAEHDALAKSTWAVLEVVLDSLDDSE